MLCVCFFLSVNVELLDWSGDGTHVKSLLMDDDVIRNMQLSEGQRMSLGQQSFLLA